MSLYPPPQCIDTEVYAEMPARFRRAGVVSEWSRANKAGAAADCFLEAPCFDRSGNLYVVDIPFGRIFRVSPSREWTLVVEYDGEPNGLALHPDGRLLIADYKNGLLALDVASGEIRAVLARRNAERFKGLNDLSFALNGDLYFTDQGQTGLHDPSGRVYRLRGNGQLDCLLANGPSPNGLVLHPSENVLFVAMTRDNAVWRLPLLPDGGTAKVGRFAQFYGVSGPDAMAMDEHGNLVVAHASLGAAIVLDADGEPVSRIASCRGRTTTNVAFGGANRQSIYITESATGTILKADWSVPGRELYGEISS